MSATIQPSPAGLLIGTLSIEFMVNPERLDDIAVKAAEVDDGNNGEHLATYTLEQALLVIFHVEPEWLFTNIKLIRKSPRLPLVGWVVNTDVGWTDEAETHEEGQ